MKCNNSYCLWNYGGVCTPESQEVVKGAIPNTLDCPTSFRNDLEEAMWDIHDECVSMMKKRTLKELMTIKEFIKGQRT